MQPKCICDIVHSHPTSCAPLIQYIDRSPARVARQKHMNFHNAVTHRWPYKDPREVEKTKDISPEVEMLKELQSWGPDSCSRQQEWYDSQAIHDYVEDGSVASTVKSLGDSWVPDPFEWIPKEDGTYEKKLRGKYNVQYYHKDGAALPMYLDNLAELLHKQEISTKDQIRTWYETHVYDDHYFQTLVAQVYHHELFDEFEGFTINYYELSHGEWFFGHPDGDQLEDMIDFTHYMLASKRVMSSTVWGSTSVEDPTGPGDYTKEEEKETKDETKVEEEKAEEEDVEMKDASGTSQSADDKNLANQQELAKISEEKEKPSPPLRRQRTKGPGNENGHAENTENKKADPGRGVTWSPLTKKGVVDFIGYCKGVPSHVFGDQQPQHASMPSTRNNLHDQNLGHDLKWQPIKLGEASYLLDSLFGQVTSPVDTKPGDMDLQQLIDYTKTIDFDTLQNVPEGTPVYVKSTIWAIGSMWVTYGTDNAAEVRQWLEKQCLDLLKTKTMHTHTQKIFYISEAILQGSCHCSPGFCYSSCLQLLSRFLWAPANDKPAPAPAKLVKVHKSVFKRYVKQLLQLEV